jgi:hypothetical protein
VRNGDLTGQFALSEGVFLTREKGELLTSQLLAYTVWVDLLPPPDPAAGLPEAAPPAFDSDPLARLLVQAEASFRLARAPATQRAYEHDWRSLAEQMK